MRASAVALVAALAVALFLAPLVAGQPELGAACASIDASGLASDPGAAAPQGLEAQAESQRVTVRWQAVAGAQGYVVTVNDGVSTTTRGTSATECAFSATNGRVYAIHVAAVTADGDLGPASEPVGARPALAGDFAYLAAGLAVVWVAIWLYAAFVLRRQNRLLARYEALFKERQSGESP